MGCASYQFEKQPPFKIISAEYINTVGGLPNSGSSIINIVYKSPKDIKFDSIFYFSDKVKAIKSTLKKNKIISGRFYHSISKVNRDLILDEDPKKEYGNMPSQKNIFNLKENEVVISYYDESKLKFYKIDSLKQGKSTIRQ